MKTCPACGNSVRDEAKFCDRCGAPCPDPEKKLSYAERRAAKDRETQRILDASYLHPEQSPDRPAWDTQALTIRPVGKAKKLYAVRMAACVCAALLIVGCMIGVVILRSAQMHNNLKLGITLGMFLISAASLAVILDFSYWLRSVHAMQKSTYAVQKISYGKPPWLLVGDTLYRLEPSLNCPDCDSPTHIEQTDGILYVVCDTDRTHLFPIDPIALRNRVLPNDSDSPQPTADTPDQASSDPVSQ